MATAKKSASALQKDLTVLDRRIKTTKDQLSRYQNTRKKLVAKINAAQASELMSIMAENEIPFESAKGILAAAKKMEDGEVEQQ